MKFRLFTLLSCLFIYSASYAQDSTKTARANRASKITYGAKFGMNAASTTRTSSGSEVNTVNMKTIIAIQASVFTDIPVSKNLSIQPALLYTNKGQSKDLSGTSNDVLYKISYLELPVNVVYKYKNFFVGAGPYMATALKGTVEKGTQNKVDVRFGSNFVSGVGSSSNAEWEEYDYGANVQLGYKLKIFVFSFGYDLGFKDIDPNPLYKSKTRTASFSVGLAF